MQTSCPECRTAFRVSQEQLALRRGLVRCGQCNAVFNAYDTLLPELEEPPIVPPEPVQDALSASGAVPELGQGIPEEATPVPPASFSDPGTEFPPGLPPEAATAEPASAAAPIEPEEAPEPAVPPAGETAESILLSELPTRQRARPALPLGLRLAFGFAVVALLALLLLQIALFLRAELAAAMPPARPILENLCRPLGCTVPLPRQLGREAIASSNLEHDPEQKSRVRLTLLLANRTGQAQAWPVISLVLTDMRESPVARKLFPPQVYLPKDADVASGLADGREREIRLELDIGNLAATGYALNLVHP